MGFLKKLFDKKPDTVVEVFRKRRFWRLRDTRNHEVLCHSEGYASPSKAVEGGERMLRRLKNGKLVVK